MKYPPLLRRYVIFSASLFLVILVAGSLAFFFSMRHVIRENKSVELAGLLDSVRMKFEAFVSRETAAGVSAPEINPSALINEMCADYDGREKAKLYFFRADGMIAAGGLTAPAYSDKDIKRELGDIGLNIFFRLKSLRPGEVQNIPGQSAKAAVTAIPELELYAAAVSPDTIHDYKNGMTAIFILGLLAIALILVLTNIFIAGLLAPLRRTIQASQEATKAVWQKREEILASIQYARNIQQNMLPGDGVFEEAFADHSIIWKPRDIVGGDIYWIKNFAEGTVLCVCDCTGHGTPGALLTMLVASAFETIVWPGNCNDTAEIIWELEQRLVTAFGVEADDEIEDATRIRDGCDLAVLFIAKNGGVTISSGRTNIFICDGEETRRIKGQRISVGEGKLKSADDIETIHIPHDPNNKFYVASDGLFDQPGGDRSIPFGYKAFEKLIMLHHNNKLSVTSDRIWAAFEKHRGEEPQVDDFELITFKP